MHARLFCTTPIGDITLEENGTALTLLAFGAIPPGAGSALKETPLLRKATAQIHEYFAGTRTAFDLPLHLEGTPFQKAVWQTLAVIPYGETRSYKDIAETVGSPKACRAVGMANRKNPLCIIIPCHRVIGADGSLTGFGGGIPVKEHLLALEHRV